VDIFYSIVGFFTKGGAFMLPILLVANDPDYMGARVNGRLINFAATIYLIILTAVSVAAVPLIIITRGGA
jgi:hypothetical protein